jgi:hypothetical protein
MIMISSFVLFLLAHLRLFHFSFGVCIKAFTIVYDGDFSPSMILDASISVSSIVILPI